MQGLVTEPQPHGRHAVVAEGVSNKSAYSILFGSWASWTFDAMDAGVFSFVLLSIAHSFKVGIGDVASTVAWFLLATGIGGLLLGNISDKIGRKRTLLISVLVYGIGTLLCGFANSLGTLNIYRFIVGLAVGGLWSAAAALVSEVWRPEGRAKAISIMQTGWAVGNLFAAIGAWVILNPHDPASWRHLFEYACIPAFLTFLYILFFVKESPIWLENKANFRKGQKRASIIEIFKPEHLKTTLLALLVATLSMFGYWIICTFTPTFLQSTLKVRIDQAPVFLVWFGVGSAAGYVIYGYMADWLGHRKSFAVYLIGMTIMVPVFTYTASHMSLTNGKLDMNSIPNLVTLGIISALLGFFLGYFSGFGAWFSELFPTDIRATAVGFCFNFGRVGAIIGIKLVPALIPVIGFTFAQSIAAIAFFVTIFIVFALRETRGTVLTAES
jgi:MFS family permease